MNVDIHSYLVEAIVGILKEDPTVKTADVERDLDIAWHDALLSVPEALKHEYPDEDE